MAENNNQNVTNNNKKKTSLLHSKKRKRGRTRNPKDEDVCFRCYDGGDLIICDVKNCSKVYHTACTGRDPSFFQTFKNLWKCSRHYCDNCAKTAYHMCYTCTYSLCKTCISEDEFVCVRKNKGFCKTCMRAVMQIENNEPGYKEEVQEKFKERDVSEHLFTDYWKDLKEKRSFTSDELSQARNRSKGSVLLLQEKESSGQRDDANGDPCSNSEISEALEVPSSRERTDRLCTIQEGFSSEARFDDDDDDDDDDGALCDRDWARKELLDFISFVRNGDTSVLSQFDVQALLLEYIKRNNLRDPDQKSQILCDSRLKNLFGKVCIGHFEMFRYLRSYLMEKSNQETRVQARIFDSKFSKMENRATNKFLVNVVVGRSDEICTRGEPMSPEMNHDYYAASVAHPATEGDSDHLPKTSSNRIQKIRKVGEHKSTRSNFDNAAIGMQVQTDGGSKPVNKVVLYKRTKFHKKGEDSLLETNLDDYAAIDVHNIGLLYLRRNLLEDLLEDSKRFHDIVVGSFVRIRIDPNQKQDMHRLAQVVDTVRAPQPYKTGRKTTDVLLKTLNLSKIEVTPIGRLSNEKFTEDECNALRQSIRCSSISQITVNKFQEKAITLHEVRVNDSLEREKMRLRKFCDWAAEKGRRKELKEGLEQLQLLSDPNERMRRVLKIPKIHADPNMGPKSEAGADKPRL